MRRIAVFRSLPGNAMSGAEAEFEYALSSIGALVNASYAAVETVVVDEFENNYLASLFKNASRCREIAAAARAVMA